MSAFNLSGEIIATLDVLYNASNYGVLPGNTDNTSALNTLISSVNANGGGVIWLPNGTYNFLKDSSTSAMGGNAQNCVYLLPNVSIIGESIDGTILKLSGATNTGCSLFGSFYGYNDAAVLTGCIFASFTVDMTDLTMSTYSHKGKAFYMHGVKDCVFRDLRLISTPSTAFGIDMLDNVVIDSVYVYNGGRQWSSGGNGGAGIGIGTGLWANENYVIRNCICDSCGHFGIFLEDQGLFATPKVQNFAKGQIIANNIVRNGRNYGIGVRGGRYVLVQGNNVYSNTNGGIYLDYGADRSFVTGNLISDETNAVCFGTESSLYACTRIVITNNTFAGCTNGVVQTLTPTDCIIQDNITVA